jgi:hypothetical protein
MDITTGEWVRGLLGIAAGMLGLWTFLIIVLSELNEHRISKRNSRRYIA